MATFETSSQSRSFTVSVTSETRTLSVDVSAPENIENRNELLGILYTNNEVLQWESRSINGPYKTIANEPQVQSADWDRRIIVNVNDYIANEQGGTPTKTLIEHPYLISGALPITTNQNVPNFAGVELRDISFWSLINRSRLYETPIKRDLLSYEGYELPSLTSQSEDQDSGIWRNCFWYVRMLMSYDFAKWMFTSSEKTIMEAFFYQTAFRVAERLDTRLISYFPNRDSDDYTPSNVNFFPFLDEPGPVPYYDGAANMKQIALIYNNRRSCLALYCGLVGAMLNNTYLITQAKRFFQEFIRFSCLPNGAPGEWQRNGSGGTNWQGIFYEGILLQNYVMVADALRRIGDNSLYTYSTSEGYGPTVGGPKTLEVVLNTYCDVIEETSVFEYDGVVANPFGQTGDGGQFITDLGVLPIANKYYDSTRYQELYLRDPRGTDYATQDYQSIANEQGLTVSPFGGYSELVPGMLFMYSQLEDLG